jgi:5-formyltetrahydrofolate cyclo-ligase
MTQTSKVELRKQLRAARRAHVEALPEHIRALLFHRPPAPLMARIETGATIGLYHAGRWEAPAHGYARFFHEAGHPLALPRFGARDAAMGFARHTDPHGDSDLEVGPFAILQPRADADPCVPQVLFVPLVGFTAEGLRIGQGGGHYDRWLSEHPGVLTIGLAWDVQLRAALPCEPHDRLLDAIVTPTRLYGLT